MRRQREETELEHELVKRVKESIPENVLSVVALEHALGKIPQMIHNLISGQSKKVADYLITTDELFVYHVYLILKEMENQIIVYNIDSIFKKYNIWNRLTKKLFLHDSNSFNLIISKINELTERETYSPRWVFWSIIKLIKTPLHAARTNIDFTFTFEHRSNPSNVVIVEFLPSRALVIYKKKIDTFLLDIKSLNGHQKNTYHTQEIKIPVPQMDSIIMKPGWIFYITNVVPYVYQMFTKGYILTTFNDNMYTNETLMIADKCTNCDQQAKFRCQDHRCDQLLFCSETCHSKIKSNFY